MDDPGFNDKGSAVRYVVSTGNAVGPFHVEVELWYQPIGFRWAHNLAPYQASEPQRMVKYYVRRRRESLGWCWRRPRLRDSTSERGRSRPGLKPRLMEVIRGVETPRFSRHEPKTGFCQPKLVLEARSFSFLEHVTWPTGTQLALRPRSSPSICDALLTQARASA